MDRMRRALTDLASQDVALANASDAADKLAERRLEQEDVDSFLARRWKYSSAVDAARDHWSTPG